MKRITQIGMVAALAASSSAWAVDYSVVGLGFENLQVLDSQAGVYLPAQVWQFYDGGYSRTEDGGTNLLQGPDYNVVFNDSALAYRSIAEGNGTGNFGPRYLDTQSGPLLTGLGIAALAFTVDTPVLNYASGFGAGFSFYYASQGTVTVTLYSGLDGTGSIVGSGSFLRTPTCDLDDNSNCAWALAALSVNGTARSVKLDGIARQTLFDNVTFGSRTPIDGVVPVPEPTAYALMAVGLLGVGLATRRRRG